MVNCERCNKSFRDQYNLTSHLSRKNKCVKIIEHTVHANELPVHANELPVHANELPVHANELPINANELPVKKNELNCEFCFKTFSNIQNRTKHYNICKSQDDPIRRLEIESNITPTLPTCQTECRFCNKVLSSKTKLNQHKCAEREKYHNELKKRPVINNIINNIINNNNTTINNIYINNHETTNSLKIASVMNELKKIKKIICKSQEYLTAGTWITAVYNMIKAEPGNQNVLLTSTKAMTGQYLTASGWVTKPTESIVELYFQQTAVRLQELEQQLKEYNSLAMDTNKETWGEVNHFARKGLTYHGVGGSATAGDQVRRVRTGFKVALVKNKNFI
jgi:hypothetical protein